jgi:hypothetical protein
MRTSPLLWPYGTSSERNSALARPLSGTSTVLLSITRPFNSRVAVRDAFCVANPAMVASTRVFRLS